MRSSPRLLLLLFFSPCTLYFGGEAHPWTQQLAVHAPCYFLSNTPLISFRLPPPLLFMLDLQQLLSSGRRAHQRAGPRRWRWWCCWGPLAGRCLKMPGGGCSHLLRLCNQRFWSALFSSQGWPAVTPVSEPTCCFLFLSGFSCCRFATPPSTPPRQPPLLRGYNKTQSASGTPRYRVTLKQVKQMPDGCLHSAHHLWLLQIPRRASCLYVFVCDI